MKLYKNKLVSLLLEDNDSDWETAEILVLEAIVNHLLGTIPDELSQQLGYQYQQQFSEKDLSQNTPEEKNRRVKGEIGTNRKKQKEILSPALLQKMHHFLYGRTSSTADMEARRTTTNSPTWGSSFRNQYHHVPTIDGPVNKKGRKTQDYIPPIQIKGLPQRPDLNNWSFKESLSDWRIENIWAGSDRTAEVDITVLWTNIHRVSFLGDMDSNPNMDLESTKQKKESLLWYFHVKKDTKKKKDIIPEPRLFNSNTSPTSIFGKDSAGGIDIDDRIRANAEIFAALKKVPKGRRGKKNSYSADAPELEHAAEEIKRYINNRLYGNHWEIRVSPDLTSAECTKIRQFSTGSFVNVKIEGSKAVVYSKNSDDTFSLRIQGNNLVIEDYKGSSDQYIPYSDTINNPNHDVDDQYWEWELNGHTFKNGRRIPHAKDTKFLYLFVNRYVDSHGNAAELGGDQGVSWGDFSNYNEKERFTNQYLHQQKFYDVMKNVIKPALVDKDLISDQDDPLRDNVKLPPMLWTNIVLDSNEIFHNPQLAKKLFDDHKFTKNHEVAAKKLKSQLDNQIQQQLQPSKVSSMESSNEGRLWKKYSLRSFLL